MIKLPEWPELVWHGQDEHPLPGSTVLVKWYDGIIELASYDGFYHSASAGITKAEPDAWLYLEEAAYEVEELRAEGKR